MMHSLKTLINLQNSLLSSFKPKKFKRALVWVLLALVVLLSITAIADGVDGIQKFVQFLIRGIGLGVIYALIALGFVIIYKSTKLFNFAQGGFVALGAYLSVQLINEWNVPFYLGIIGSIILMALFGAAVERSIIRPMLGKPLYTTVLITLGLLLAITQVIQVVWTQPVYILIAPWAGDTSELLGININHEDLWNVLIALVLLVLFWILFQFTNLGLSMRATAVNQEIAAGQGINVGLSFSVSWMIAGAIGAISGTLLIFESGSTLSPAIGFVSLKAFPAMILGGLDSIIGAVLAGILLGIIELMAKGYIDVEWLGGSNFANVVPYIVMIGVLLWRPEGFLGTKQVQRL